MQLLRGPIQRKLSQLLGADVTFERLDVSLVGGSIDAEGLTVAGPGRDAPPLLTVRRLRAEISVPRALAKEVVVKSLTLERPELTLTQRTPAAAPPHVADPADVNDPDGTPRAWRLEAQKVLVVDGVVRYRAPGPLGTFELLASGVLADLSAAPGGMDFTCIVESLRRLGHDVDLGELRLIGHADGVHDLSQWSRARVGAKLEAGPSLKAELNLPSVRPLEAEARVVGKIDLARLASLLPVVVPVAPAGEVQIDARAAYDMTRGLRVHELNLRGTDLTAARTAD